MAEFAVSILGSCLRHSIAAVSRSALPQVCIHMRILACVPLCYVCSPAAQVLASCRCTCDFNGGVVSVPRQEQAWMGACSSSCSRRYWPMSLQASDKGC